MSVGLSPDGGDPPDERYSLLIEDGRVAAARGGTGRRRARPDHADPAGGHGAVRQCERNPGAGRADPDAPRYAWRGLSLDVARTFFPVAEIRRVIDLLELYKLNVLHLHLTDDEAWPLALGQPPASPEPGAPFYRDEDLPTWPVTPRTASSRSFPRSTRPGTPPRCCGCGRT